MTTDLHERYVLITPARNEESYIEGTIRSVAEQTLLPSKWVIVSDGSVDRTDEIVRAYAKKHSFIKLIRVSGGQSQDFRSKANAFNIGFKEIKDSRFGYIGNLDADVSFEKSYYEEILRQFHEGPKLGIGGGMILELIDGRYVAQNVSLNSVAGAVQLFRRECYMDVGGYMPIRTGGIDTVAEIMARARGWEVRTFPNIHVLHHRRVITGNKSIVLTRFHQGITNYRLGYSLLFQIASCLYRFCNRPYIIGGTFTLIGYLWASVRKTNRLLPDDVRKYLRSEQQKRLKALVLGPKHLAETGEKKNLWE